MGSAADLLRSLCCLRRKEKRRKEKRKKGVRRKEKRRKE
jgi:hypothetical protein